MTAPVIDQTNSLVEMAEETTGELRVRFPCLAIEGLDTRDGRFLDAGKITAGMLPMSILAQLKSPHGGDDPPAATVVGRLDTITRTPGPDVISRRTGQPFPEGTFVWSGDGAISTGVDVEGCNVADFVRRRYLRGSSADLLPSDFTILGEEGFTPGPESPSRRLIVHAGEIGGVTIVPIAAFGECSVELAEETVVPDPITPEELPVGLMASAVPAWRAVELGDEWGPLGTGLTAAAADKQRTGGMVALVPANAEQLAVEGGEPVEELHLTLAYLGEDVTDWSTENIDILLTEMHELIEGSDPIEGRVMGHAVFNPDGFDDRDPCAVYLVGDAPWIANIHPVIRGIVEHKVGVPEQHVPFIPHVTAGYGLDPSKLRFTGPILFNRLRVALAGEVTDFPLPGEPESVAESPVTASGLPVLPTEDIYLDAVVTASATPRKRPPLSRFADPGFTELTPITIEEPYVYGHLAPWNRPHLSFNGRPVYAPRSRTDYREFMRGGVRVDDNGTVRVAAVGHLVFDAGHADTTSLSASDAARYYDHTGYSWARVAAGEDQFGIWVAGILRPGITEDQVDTALAHPPSGDWRPVGNSLELVAALSVNTAGFGVPRARVASGQIQALVAGGGMQPRRAFDAPRASGTTVLDYDTLADAIATRLDRRAVADELATAHASLVTELDDTDAVVAALLAEVDDTPQLMTELLAELDTEAFDVSRMPPKLRESYLRGKVAARIGWGTPGDFDRCVAQARHHDVPARMRNGMCATLHKQATGQVPGKH